MSESTLMTLCRELTRAFERDEKGKEVARILESYAGEQSGWRALEFFRSGCYTRTLVHKDETYELLLLCWAEGQESPVHNHMDQNCWMAVLDGKVEELLFDCPGGAPCGPLAERRSLTFDSGGVAYISDDIGLHLVRPVGGPAVSLHLYSRPYAECLVYDRQTGEERTHVLSYDAIDGRQLDAAVPASTIAAD